MIELHFMEEMCKSTSGRSHCYVAPIAKSCMRKEWSARKTCELIFHLQLLACIGEHFTEGDDICGAVVNIRRMQDRLSIWTKTASDEAIQVMCMLSLHKLLSLMACHACKESGCNRQMSKCLSFACNFCESTVLT